MLIKPQGLTKAQVTVPTGYGRKVYLGIKYFGTKSEAICKPATIKIPMSQEEAFELIKAVALECQAANLRPSVNYESIEYEVLETYDEPIQTGKLYFSMSEYGIGNEVGLPIQVNGGVYGDTFIATMTGAGKFNGHSKGFLSPYAHAVDRYKYEFDLTKTNGKLVLDYWMHSSYPENQWWVAYEGDALKAGGTFYGIKKVSTIRRNVEIVI